MKRLFFFLVLLPCSMFFSSTVFAGFSCPQTGLRINEPFGVPAGTTEFPTNGILYNPSISQWQQEDGTPLSLQRDATLSKLLRSEIYRAASGNFPAKTNLYPSACRTMDCQKQFVRTGTTADTNAPSQPAIEALVVEWVPFPRKGTRTFGPFSQGCSDQDTLSFAVTFKDDKGSLKTSTLLFWIGRDRAELQQKQQDGVQPSLVTRVMVTDTSPRDRTVLKLNLGDSSGHQREGIGLSRKGSFCFQVAWVDWAGNLSPRSKPTCLDTTDKNDPHVRWAETSGCACSTQLETPPPGWPLLFLLYLLLQWLRRKSNREVASR